MKFEELLESERLTLEGIGKGKLSALERRGAEEEGEEETEEVEADAEKLRREMREENKKTAEIAAQHTGGPAGTRKRKVSALNDLNAQLVQQRMSKKEKRTHSVAYSRSGRH